LWKLEAEIKSTFRTSFSAAKKPTKDSLEYKAEKKKKELVASRDTLQFLETQFIKKKLRKVRLSNKQLSQKASNFTAKAQLFQKLQVKQTGLKK
jgi:hypothetical protein